METLRSKRRGKLERVQEGDEVVIYTTRITLKNGKVLYAWQYGLKAFRLKVRKAA